MGTKRIMPRRISPPIYLCLDRILGQISSQENGQVLEQQRACGRAITFRD